MLRTAALQLARGDESGRNEAAQGALLVAQIGILSLSISPQRGGGAGVPASNRRPHRLGQLEND